MHVIDFLRMTTRASCGPEASDETAIELPAYHRGHLGFLPDTAVHLGIHGEGHLYEKGCELIISAYPSVTTNLAELSCTMQDSRGVVNKLLSALRSLNVNILVAETYSIKHNKRHHLELVFDWSTSRLPMPDPVPLAFQSTIDRLSTIIPTDDFRYLRLMARILQCCAGDLEWRPATPSGGLILPVLRLRSFERRSTFAGTGRSLIRKEALPLLELDGSEEEPASQQRKKTRLLISLSDIEPELRRILTRFGERSLPQSESSPLPYLMLSDTATRSLRVWFPLHDGTARQIIHIGFEHSDIAGALETITKILRFSDLNILTSLLRRGKFGKNIWEVHLQYEQDDEHLREILNLDDRRTRVKQSIDWLCSRIDLESVQKRWAADVCNDPSEGLSLTLARELRKYNVRVRAPQYPYVENAEELERPFLWSQDGLEEDGAYELREDERTEDPAGVADRRHWARVAVSEDGELDKPGREWARVLAVTDGIPVPRVFLSYPSTAERHAELLKAAIKEKINGRGEVGAVRLIIDEFHDPNLQEISPTVLAMIRRADFFLGIWHPDQGQENTVSPWMPYEYGVASALGKPATLIVRDTIPPNVWRRIDPHISKHRYSDLKFQTETVPSVIKHIETVWLTQIKERERRREMARLWRGAIPQLS